MENDYYAILGLPTTASEADIQSRFREMVKTSHPDRAAVEDRSAALENFQQITQAANTLLDPKRRLAYDRQRMQGERSSSGPDEATRVLIQRGVTAFRDGDLRTAFESLQRATSAAPQEARAWHLLAQVAVRIPPKRGEAVNAARKSVDLEPHNPKYLITAALVHAAAGRTAAATSLADQAEQWGADAERVAEVRRRIGQ